MRTHTTRALSWLLLGGVCVLPLPAVGAELPCTPTSHEDLHVFLCARRMAHESHSRCADRIVVGEVSYELRAHGGEVFGVIQERRPSRLSAASVDVLSEVVLHGTVVGCITSARQGGHRAGTFRLTRYTERADQSPVLTARVNVTRPRSVAPVREETIVPLADSSTRLVLPSVASQPGVAMPSSATRIFDSNVNGSARAPLPGEREISTLWVHDVAGETSDNDVDALVATVGDLMTNISDGIEHSRDFRSLLRRAPSAASRKSPAAR